MGRHRAAGSADQHGTIRRRGIAAWPIVGACLAVLLALGWAGWTWAQGATSDIARAQDARCPEGGQTLRVVVTPGIEGPVSAAARSWNGAGTVVHGHCVHTRIDAIPSSRVHAALTGEAPLASIGGLPNAWVPADERWLVELRDTRPGLISASAESIASSGSADYPYVGFTGSGISSVHERAAQTFRAYMLREPQRQPFVRAGLGPPNRAS